MEIHDSRPEVSLPSFLCFSFQYLLEISEVESWVQEKLPLVFSREYGRDETTAQAILRKHEAFSLELETYEGKMRDLESRSLEFSTADYFDTENMKKRQVSADLHCPQKENYAQQSAALGGKVFFLLPVVRVNGKAGEGGRGGGILVSRVAEDYMPLFPPIRSV